MGHMFTILDKKRYLEQLFRENYTRLYYYALSFLNDSELARDVVSNAFEAVWVGRDRLEFSSSLVPFVYRLVRNACLDELRHQKTTERFVAYMKEQPEAFDERELREYELLIERIHHAVEELPAQTRNVFKMCFLEGKKYHEVGVEFGITVNTVKAHVMKALRLLREQFSGEDFILFFLCMKKRAEKR